MKKVVSMVVALAFVLGVSLVIAGDAPDKLTIQANEKKPVEFNHKFHSDKYECATCHHKWDGNGQPATCTSCHEKADGDAPKRHKAFHSKTSETSCVGCHTKAGGNAPTKCADCHPKK